MNKIENKFLKAAKLNKSGDIRKIVEKLDKEKSKKKLRKDLNIDCRDINGSTALHQAAKNGNVDIMLFLISRGADIEIIDQIGWRPISYACAHNHINAVKTLIQWNSNVNKFSLMEDNSPLHIAAGFGYIDIVKLLIQHGAKVNSQNRNKKTPLEVACDKNQYKIVNILLSASSSASCSEDQEFKNLPIDNFLRSKHESLSRSSLFVKSQSVNNANHIISRIKPGSQANGDLQFKRRTMISHLCTPMEVPVPKKSGSLNTLFLNDQSIDELNHNSVVDQLQGNRDSETINSQLEVNSHHPLRYSVSEKPKLQSQYYCGHSCQMFDSDQRTTSYLTRPSGQDHNSVSLKFANGIQNGLFNNSMTQNRSTKDIRPLSLSFQESIQMPPSISYSGNSKFLTPYNYNSSNSRSKNVEFKARSRTRKSQSIPRNFRSEREIKESPELTKDNSKNSTISPKSIIFNEPHNRSSSRNKFVEDIYNINKIQEDHDEKCTCFEWIKSLGLEKIWENLFREGFESFLSLSLATNNQLLRLCDNDVNDWDLLKRSLHSLQIPGLDQLEFSTKILDVLIQLGLEYYGKRFKDNGYINTENILNFDENDLDKLRIFRKGHRKLILSCFEILQSSFKFMENSQIPIIELTTESGDSKNLISPSILRNKSDDMVDNQNNENRFLLERPNVCPNTTISKKLPPPIPSRSSSILDDQDSNNLSLDQGSLNSNVNQILELIEKKENNIESNLSCLDDIVDLLSNLGQKLDVELNIS